MKGNVSKFSRITAVAMAGLLYAGSAFSQIGLLPEPVIAQEPRQQQAFSMTRNTVMQPFNDGPVGDAVSFNVGVLYSPVSGLDLRADAWRSQPEPAAVLAAPIDILGSATPRLFIDDLNEGNLEMPFVNLNGGRGMQSQGIDLSASYVWDSPRFGQFIVSTKATYVYDLTSTELLREASLTPLNATPGLNLNADLQTSLTLTWQIGNHTASAVTHYAGLSDDISNIDMEEFNEIVGNLTTLDLQYGYTLKAGKQGNAVISVGLRSVLDKREGRLLFDAGTLGGERSGHMAYGSIKYQF